MAATATYGQPVDDNADWYVDASVQHVGNRYTQPGDQENNPRTSSPACSFGPTPATGQASADRDFGSKLPPTIWSTCRPASTGTAAWSVVLYVNNLFDENAKLSFDRERGGRARLGFNIGQPRTIGVTVRQVRRTDAGARRAKVRRPA